MRRRQRRTQPVAPAAPVTVAAPEVLQEPTEEDLTDDLELVAVITAAIAASETYTPATDLVVRSIKKANRRNLAREPKYRRIIKMKSLYNHSKWQCI